MIKFTSIGYDRELLEVAHLWNAMCVFTNNKKMRGAIKLTIREKRHCFTTNKRFPFFSRNYQKTRALNVAAGKSWHTPVIVRMSKGVAEQFSEFLEKFLRAVGPWIRLLCMSCGISADCCQSFRQNLLQQGLNALRAYKPPNTMDIHSLQQFLANPHNDNKRLSDLQKQFACMWHANKCIKVNSVRRNPVYWLI